MTGIEIWKDIKGYKGIYQATITGKIRKLYKGGTVTVLKPYIKHGQKSQYVGLIREGIKKEIKVSQIVARTFIGEPEPGQVVHHVNGLINDNWASNLAYIDEKQLGRLNGGKSRRKGVAKINKKGEAVDFYSSAREAGRKNFMSYQTIIDRCNGKVKGAFAPDGYAYAWEDSEISMKDAMYKISKAKENEKWAGQTLRSEW